MEFNGSIGVATENTTEDTEIEGIEIRNEG
jgi:hypothetical protein